MSACQSTSCTGSGFARFDSTYDGEGHRIRLVETPASGTATTTEFRYQGDAVASEVSTTGAVVITRTFTTDESGAIIKMAVAGDPIALHNGEYLVTWNGHGDALALSKINGDGTLTAANRFTYSTWGTPSVGTPNGYGDLRFRYLYVGRFDVQWDHSTVVQAGLLYMHARHYSPEFGRFLQPDPSALETNLYGYTENSPITKVDPSGTCWWFLLPAATGIGAVAAAPSFAVCVIATAGLAYYSARTAVLARDLYNDWKYDQPLRPPRYSGIQVLRTDRKLTGREVKQLEGYLGEDAEHIKTPGGRGAGKYDLWVRPDGQIVVKPRTGKGTGDPVGATLRDINRRGGR